MTIPQISMVERAQDILEQVREQIAGNESDAILLRKIDVAIWKLQDVQEIERDRYAKGEEAKK